MHNWYVYRKFEDTAKACADFIAGKIEESIRERGVCHIVLPGGSTPAGCLAYLAQKNLQWNKTHWYPGDERCYPAGHEDRNDVMLQKNFWCRLSGIHTYPIKAELGAEKAAELYRETISVIECFDIAFLGMGEDGHTASLFPESNALEDQRSVIPVHNSPKAPDDRVSLSVKTLSKARCKIVLTGGKAKSEVIKRIKNNAVLPINSLGDIVWFLDEAANSDV